MSFHGSRKKAHLQRLYSLQDVLKVGTLTPINPVVMIVLIIYNDKNPVRYTESGLKLPGLDLVSLATQGVCTGAQSNAYTGYGILGCRKSKKTVSAILRKSNKNE